MSVTESWNHYSYVENDPIDHVDPTSHKKKIEWPNGVDQEDDSRHTRKKAKACKNPGQYTGSCEGGPPNVDLPVYIRGVMYCDPARNR